VAGACGGSESKGSAKTTKLKSGEESGLAEAGTPVRGGRIVYGMSSETSGGFCLPESTLGTAGNLIRQALYDTLTVLDDHAQAKPFLAESVEHDATFSTWTIGLRSGVTFHDDTKLDATVVKNNLDAYVGRYSTRKPKLYGIVLDNIDKITVKDDMTVEVTTKTPWPALPAWLAGMGMMAQAQLDDTEHCDTNMIGTGPFELSSWTKDQELLAQRNPHYWEIAPDGKPYPYADAIAFRPIPDSQQRINALDSGEINVLSTNNPIDIHGPLTDLEDAGRINLLASTEHSQTNYVLMNNSKPPFDDENMRRALAMGIDRDELNDITNGGNGVIANQPFPKGDMGYVDDPGFPTFDPVGAKKLVDAYVAGGGKATVTVLSNPDPIQLARVEVVQNQLKKVGIAVKIRTADSSTIINEIIAGSYQAATWAQHPGGDPDLEYVFWHDGLPTNFSRINDPVINKALEDGRVEIDPTKRRQIYEGLSRQFAAKVYMVWLTYAELGIAMAKNVHGVFSAELPDNGGKVFTGLVAGHPVQGMWVANG
jgi:peptide/nickel transport system substrate-binding protein